MTSLRWLAATSSATVASPSPTTPPGTRPAILITRPSKTVSR
jgi:hypothetical protein